MKDITEEMACACALNRIFGFRPKDARALIEHYGSAYNVFHNDDKSALADNVRAGYTRLLDKKEIEISYRELESLDKSDTDFVSITGKFYPSLLKECCDAPIGLYIKGKDNLEEITSHKKAIAIVGTRDISPYGSVLCRKIVQAIGETKHKPVIVSGLAIGVDSIAHRTALEYGLPTIAVMATGIDDIYPFRNTSLANKILSSPGSGLLTDYPVHTSPVAMNFIRRNRIIAGLADAVILIESKIKGGGMITARLGFSYDREVFALPGRVEDLRSSGCNKLISTKVAEAIFSPEDLVGKLGLGRIKKSSRISAEEIMAGREFAGLDKGYKDIMSKIIDIIGEAGWIGIDDICMMTGLPYAELSYMLTLLESERIIRVDILQRCSLNS